MIHRIRGVKDVLPDDISLWYTAEQAAHRLAQSYGFKEIRTPMFEDTSLFVRSIGGETDIVEKEMYTFPDRDGTSLTLRPEGTASVVRAFIENRLLNTPTSRKLYYIGPMFRHERPQAGRFRQFHQFGVESIGSPSPMIDIEVISLLWRFFSSLQIDGLALEVNSLGVSTERQQFKDALLGFLVPISANLCGNCQRRMHSNTLRVLDCKVPSCRTATAEVPTLSSFLSSSSSDHFQQVLEGLDLLNIPYVLNHRLVRGLDYYSRTTFEVTCHSLGAQNAIGAGGRYDGLLETLGGRPSPGVGFAIGLERVISVLPESVILPPTPLVYVAGFGQNGQQSGMCVLEALRANGIMADTDFQSSTLKTHLRSADRLGATLTIILGDDECQNGQAILRNMSSKQQEFLPIDAVPDTLKTRLSS
ncbi:MAG: histidine--tRNA ligase [Nitrospirales bacterium]|nr:histidine--tRNA ligase [Nitrospirales bacterium]